MKRKSLLLSAVSALMVSILMLTAASFAWFEFSLTPEINGFELDIVTGESLQIGFSRDGGFSNKLYKEDIVRANAGYFPNNIEANNYKLNAATPNYVDEDSTELAGIAGAINTNVLKFYTLREGRTYQDYKDKGESVAASGLLDDASIGNDYIYVQLFLRANMGMTVYADVANLFTPHKDNKNFTDIVDALRIAYVFGQVTNPKDADTLGTIQSLVYKPDMDESDDAPLNSAQYQKVVVLGDNGRPVVPAATYADTEYNNYAATAPVDSAATGTLLKLFNADAPDTTSGEAIFDVWQVGIYIWVEGFDGDSNIESAASSFLTHLKFTGVTGESFVKNVIPKVATITATDPAPVNDGTEFENAYLNQNELESVKALFNNLPDTEKTSVGEAIDAVNTMSPKYSAVITDYVKAKIDALPKVDEVDIGDKAAINEVEELYDRLISTDKSTINDYKGANAGDSLYPAYIAALKEEIEVIELKAALDALPLVVNITAETQRALDSVIARYIKLTTGKTVIDAYEAINAEGLSYADYIAALEAALGL